MSRRPHPEKVERAQELYAKGYTIRQIATRINTQYATAKRYVDPAYDELQRQRGIERKKSYTGTCEVCGKPTSYSGKKNLPSKRCQKHAALARKFWTQEKIIEAIQRWAKIHGRPPSSVDWNATLSKHERGPEYPSSTTVFGKTRPFESWADAIEAAGFPRPKPTFSGKHGELMWTKERVLEALREHANNGVAPPSPSWDRGAPGRPTSAWVVHLFGSWTKGCHEAGLVTYREHLKGRRPRRPPKKRGDREAEQLALVRRLMDDQVLRRFIVQQLWEAWGFPRPKACARWLSDNGIEEFAGYRYQPYRQLTAAEVEEARKFSIPAGGTKAQE